MGTYNFRWSQPANEVYVTGTFDNWSRSVQLDKKHLVHEKLIALPPFDDKIFFKYVVNGEWQLDHTHPTEEDPDGNTNNVLYPDELGPPMASAHPVMSNVAPGATTTQLAGVQPLQRRQTEDVSDVPGAFPETPAPTAGEDEKKDGLAAAAGVGGIAAVGAAVLGTAAAGKKEDEKEQTFSVNPIPATDGPGNPIHLEPGEKVPHPSTYTNNTIQSTVTQDLPAEEQTFSVAPIPASAGIGNPVSLKAGEPVPHPSTYTSNTIGSGVKLDEASYNKTDAGPPVLPPVVTPTTGEAATGSLLFGLGPQTTNLIPESSLPIGNDVPAPIDEANLGPHVSSVAPTSTTAQLAGQVPLEPRGVPQVVSESQHEAHVEPEASANPTAVEEKKEVEAELKSKVPEAQSGSDNKAGIAAAVGGGLAALGAAAVTAATVVRQKTHETTGTDPVSLLPQSAQDSINNATGKPDVAAPAATSSAAPVSSTDASRETASNVPTEVQESQKAAHVDPEASANPEAVREKAAIENELLKKVSETQAAGEPAPTVAAATSTTAPAAQTSTSGAPQLGDAIVGGGLSPISMDEKPAVTGSQGLNAPATAPATTSQGLNAPADAPATVAAQSGKPPISRDVSPKSKPNTASQTQPIVTTGVDSSSAPVESTPPKNKKRHSLFGKQFQEPSDSQGRPGTSGTDATATKKKKGLIARIKEKLSHHN